VDSAYCQIEDIDCLFRVKGHEVTEENGEFLYSVEIEESLDKL
jgi:hypothetical protein